VQRHNTLAYYGNQVNDLTFNIHYRPRSHATFAAVKASLQDEQQAVELVQQEGGVRLTLAETVLFPSGSSKLTARGKKVLVRIVKGILSREGVRVVVSGHSDNIPINKRLKGKYASNWELSAARSLAVVHELELAGIGGERLEARAFGPHRPRASNESAAGRAQNRRIELELIEPQKR
jgi:chemotaxis protein MotB